VDGNSFIKEIGRSYIVSSVFPSALFVLISSFLFYGFIPPTVSNWLDNASNLFGFNWIIILIITLWIAFYLYSSTDWTYKFFEGYFLPKRLQDWMAGSLKKHWYDQLAPNYFEIRKLKNKKRRTSRTDNKIIKLRRAALSELNELELLAPCDEEYLMPTRLGNILRASELYSFERYQLISFAIWPRLFHVMPIHFIRNLEEKNNHLVFLLNSALLVYGIAILCLISGLMGFICRINIPHSLSLVVKICGLFERGYRWISPQEYIVIAAFFLWVAYRVYRIGVNAAEDFGQFIRSGFDLYRFDLLKQLNQKLPEDLEDEKCIWTKLSEFLIAGNRIRMIETNLKYNYPDNE
jgi:hypothetical protein